MAGVTAPQYGMPMSGTPIGLPGPPHIPLGIPAGLQRHTIKHHTLVHIPKPTEKIGIHVKQHPGMTYPKPARHLYVHEWARAPWLMFKMPWKKHHQKVGTNQPAPAAECVDGQCVDGAPVQAM